MNFSKAILSALFFLLPMLLLAHEIRPAYLQISEESPNVYSVLWKVPSNNDRIPDITPQFDKAFTLTAAGPEKILEGFVIFQYQLNSTKSLSGSTIRIHNLQQTTVDVLVNVQLLDGQKFSLLLHPSTASATIPANSSKWNVVKTYLGLGVEHILLGADHLLFVLALIIITKGWRRIVKTITAFTLAHSITLSLAALGYVHFPSPPVEATIALSIVFLAMEIIKNSKGEQTLTGRQPWLVAFVFGLLHGLGFAGALSEIGLPQTEIPLALAFFNIGVELGQLAFVLVVLLFIRLLSMRKDWPRLVQKIPAYAIGSIASFWLIERLVGFWN